MKPTLNLNIPDGWLLDYELKEVVDEEFGASAEYEEYFITPDQSDSISSVCIIKYLDEALIDPREYMEDMAEDYLNSLVIPDFLRPSLDEFLYHYEIGGLDACCCILPEPGEVGATISVVLEAPDHTLVDTSVHIFDYEEGAGEAAALELLKSLFVF